MEFNYIRYTDRSIVTHLMGIVSGEKFFYFSKFAIFSKMFCSLLEGKSVTAHKNGYIAAGFKPAPVLVLCTNITQETPYCDEKRLHGLHRVAPFSKSCLFHSL